MTRDYKYRAQPGGWQKQNKKSPVAFWKWLLVGVLVAAFILFLVKLRSSVPNIDQPEQGVPLPIEKDPSAQKPAVKKAKSENKTVPDEGPQFEFYTLLRDQGEIIPEYEVKKLKRAETVGKKPEPSSYILQAGSFRKFAQADKVKARLALLGIQAKIETATVGKTTWNRIKLGPYPNMRSADHVRSKLRKAGVDAVVLHEKP